ncbi:glycerol-3-phosphate dehydrogenase [Aquirhabdus parva]|uniref:Glycerol-3-phosphate dehydrogenase n=1 Tax=Aquirhabdus parva TaxID=2283318 RepID=A0A345P5I0_9GAMM|nr:glycerol-3-phosphate dehydrogenase [Aquirhabdus parva]AXI02539.1 glycerol-3-phosphate dehydrogenase [Aquirhabdus parva]
MTNDSLAAEPDLNDSIYDLVVIGGGINGVGIARDAAGRGLRVLLVEKGDFAGATSSASSKLIHGGLRYLEYYEFRLVREALAERERLLAIAPHIAWPMSFVMPHIAGLRPRWMIRTGLFLYDRLGGRISLAKSKAVTLTNTLLGKPLKALFSQGFTYSDAWVDDARLVVLNALSAQQHGAQLLPRVSFEQAKRVGHFWHIEVKPTEIHPSPEQIPTHIRARMLVNASGPWVESVRARIELNDSILDEGILESNIKTQKQAGLGQLRLVQGSHMVVAQCYEGNHAYILQHTDRRVIFMLPYEHDYTLIGTTDLPLTDPNQQPTMTDAEVEYLCDAVNQYLEHPVKPQDVIWRYSGVRPLMDQGDTDNPSAVSRDYELKIEALNEVVPLLTVLGGKLTTYRKLAEHALDDLSDFCIDLPKGWTDQEVLPGGDIPDGWHGFEAWQTQFIAQYPDLDSEWLASITRRYGTLIPQVLSSLKSQSAPFGVSDLGLHFGGGLYECEVRYLRQNEWAWQAEDILWRRTKCGLHMTVDERISFEKWFKQHNL